MATIYLGWNAIFDEDQVFGDPVLASWRLIRGACARLRERSGRFPGGGARRLHQAKTSRSRCSRTGRAPGICPKFLPEIRQIVRALHSSGSRVVLLTLPGLYELDQTPTDYMLKIGHLPIYTDNPYELRR